MCRQLGWSGALPAKASLQHGISAGRTILDNVSCPYDESDISNCYNHSRLTRKCSTGRAAAVDCDRSKCCRMSATSVVKSLYSRCKTVTQTDDNE